MVQSLVLSSWNVQRPGRERLDDVLLAIKAQSADILTLQEANRAVVEGVRELGYRSLVFGLDETHPGARKTTSPSTER